MVKEFKKDHFEGSNGVNLPYRLYNTASKQPKPLVIFLHGSGERGNDNLLPLTANDSVPTLYQYAKTIEDAVILVPQAPMYPKIGAWVFDEVSFVLEELIEFIVTQCPVDRQRIYITGLSNGGAGVWDLLIKKPHFFASAISICGYIHGEADETRVLPKDITRKQAKKIRHIPVWVFHAADDDVVDVNNSRMIVKALKEVGNQQVIYTEYSAGAVAHPHCSWDRAFDTEELLPWLFSQKREGV